MGVNLSGILQRHEVSIKDFSGQTLAIDAYNIIYQFLSNIRQPDGSPLVDDSGRITSHISGMFYRTISLIDTGIKPIYVFDGKPSKLKNRELEERKLMREKSRMQLEEAMVEGDMERVRSLSARINYITRETVDDLKKLLDLMGVPYVQAPSEGEAQAARLSTYSFIYGVVSQDFDSLLFGAKRLLRNFTFSGKRKLPGRNIYINVKPEYIDLKDNLSALHITREQLVDIGILVGTDFNRGVKGIGAKTALKLVRTYGNIYGVMKARGLRIENVDEIRDLFLNPEVIDVKEIEAKPVNAEGLIEFLCDEHSFSRERVSHYIEILKRGYGVQSQKSLDRFF